MKRKYGKKEEPPSATLISWFFLLSFSFHLAPPRLEGAHRDPKVKERKDNRLSISWPCGCRLSIFRSATFGVSVGKTLWNDVAERPWPTNNKSKVNGIYSLVTSFQRFLPDKSSMISCGWKASKSESTSSKTSDVRFSRDCCLPTALRAHSLSDLSTETYQPKAGRFLR